MITTALWEALVATRRQSCSNFDSKFSEDKTTLMHNAFDSRACSIAETAELFFSSFKYNSTQLIFKMISAVLLTIVFLVAFYRIYAYMVFRPANFPPGYCHRFLIYVFFLWWNETLNNNSSIFFLNRSGPPRIPIFGSYLLMLFLDRHHLQKAANILAKWYKSNIIGLYLGDFPTIIVNDTEKVKKALYAREFDGKPDLLIGRLRDPKMNLRGMCVCVRGAAGGCRMHERVVNVHNILISFTISLCRHFLHRWSCVARATAICAALSTRLWLRSSLPGVRNWNSRRNAEFHWHGEIWTEIWAWEGMWGSES